MMIDIFKKSILPHLLSILFFLAISYVYFSPVMEGKVLQQLDVQNVVGMQKELADYQEETGEVAMWTNSMFSGMPAYQVRGTREMTLFRLIDKITRAQLPPHTVGLLFLYLIGFYILLASLRINYWLCIIGAVAFSFASYNIVIIEAGHINKALTFALSAPVIATILLTYRGKYFLGGVLTTITLGLLIFYQHWQFIYYSMIIIFILILIKLIYAIKEKTLNSFIKASIVLLVALIFSLLPNITKLWTTSEYSKATIRGESELSKIEGKKSSGLDKDYALAWSYGKAETLTLIVPNILGGSSTGGLNEDSETYEVLKKNRVPESQITSIGTYWGDMPFTSGPAYIGAITCFLFVLGMFLVRGYMKWWIVVSTILIIMLSWGKNFIWLTDIFFYYVPMYNKFRAVSSILLMLSLLMPLLMVFALNAILSNKHDGKKMFGYLKYSYFITGGLCLVLALFPDMFFNYSLDVERLPDWLLESMRHDRKSILQADAFRSFVFISLAFGLIWLYLKNKIKKEYLLIGLSLFLLIDLWSVDKRYLNNDDFIKERRANKKSFVLTNADKQILMDNDPHYRVLNLAANTFNDASTSYYHKSIGGYHGAKLRRYQDLIEHHIGRGNMSVLNMLNAKYIISSRENNEPIARLNREALGNAWFVEKVEFVKNADEEIESLNNFNPAITAIVDERFSSYLENFINIVDSVEYIKIAEYKPDNIIYDMSSLNEKLAVFSEIYYEKGWNAYVDGEPMPHFRVDYVLRAMRIPAGEHKIEFRFEPTSYLMGMKISQTSSWIIGLILLALIAFEIKKYLGKKES